MPTSAAAPAPLMLDWGLDDFPCHICADIQEEKLRNIRDDSDPEPEPTGERCPLCGTTH